MMKKKILIQSTEIDDSRLLPLMDKTSKVVLQLYVLQITTGISKIYELLYGRCILTSRPDISKEVNSSGFHKILSNDDVIYDVAKISIYNYSEVVVKLVNDLLTGNSFKTSALNCELDIKKVKFDFNFNAAISGEYRIRPIIFNETGSHISRNLYEKYSFHSPYGGTPSFSLIVSNLDKLSIFRSAEGEYYNGYKECLLKLLNFLAEETRMGFLANECARFGNIEFINSQCTTLYETALVYFENIKTEEKIDGFKEITSKQIKLTIKPNGVTNAKKVLVNCFSRNGGQVILDEVKEAFHKEDETLELLFNTSEPVSDIVVSVWVEDGDKWQIWFKNAAVLLRSMVTSMGMVNTTGIVTSSYLEKIESSSSHLKEEVAKAKEINKTSYQKFSIGGNRLDPWVSVDYDFSLFVKKMMPDKSSAAFFPRGWNKELNEHGALAFLEWFKTICNNASNVIIIDPYFDVVGLEFLARTTNINTGYSIITCTQITSNDDDILSISFYDKIKKFFGFKKAIPKSKNPNRASRIISLLKGTPVVFSNLKLKIHDFRSTTGNNKALLHDRYILVYENQDDVKGFHLSNSIQGATMNHPLLITPIPSDIIPKIEKYSTELIDQGKKNNEFEVITLYDYLNNSNKDEIKNKNRNINSKLYVELKNSVSEDELDGKFDAIEKIVTDNINNDYPAFEKFWDVFGIFMANVSTGDEIETKVKGWISPKYAINFKKYLLEIAKSEESSKFTSNRGLERSGFYILFQDDFDKALKDSTYIENYLNENNGFGNYSAGYASSVLLSIDVDSFFELIEEICLEVEKRRGQDLNQKPIYKIAAILFYDLAVELFWHSNENVIRKSIQSSITGIRALSIEAVVSNVVSSSKEMNFEKAESYFDLLSFEESIVAYIVLLHQTRKGDSEIVALVQDKCFKKIKNLLSSQEEGFIFKTIDRMIIKYFDLVESIISNNLILPLLDDGVITMKQVYHFWKHKFELAYAESDIIAKNSGLLDIVGWSIYSSDEFDQSEFMSYLEKATKENLVQIRKPFNSGSSKWDTAYNRLLMIQTVGIIAILYFRSSEVEKDSSITDSIKKIIEEIKNVKENYPSYKEYSELHLFNKQMVEKL